MNRDLSWSASWRLAGAALMPGAIVMIASLWFYGGGLMDLVQLLFVLGAHFVVGWVYLFLSLLFVPPANEALRRKNPFAKAARR